MRRTVLYICIAAVALLAAGCKEFLEPRSQGEYSPTEISQLSELVLSAMPDPNAVENNTLSGSYLDILSDDVQTRRTITVMNSITDQWYQQSYVTAVQALYTWQSNYPQAGAYTPEYTRWEELYSSHYNKLTYVNTALDYIEEVNGTRAEKDYVKAQMLALRAFYYLNLVNIYGEPYNKGVNGQGVPIRLTGARENRVMTRNTVGEVYDRIESDLLESVDLFEGLGELEQYREFRPTLPMAMLLLARTYLYMENWEQAEFYASRLIEEWPQFQIKDLNEVVNGGYTNLTSDNPLNQRFWPHFMDYSNSDVIWAYGGIQEASDFTSREMTHVAQEDKPKVEKNGVYAMLSQASDDLISNYDENDLRLRTYFVRDLFDEPEYADGDVVSPSQKFTYHAYGKLKIKQNDMDLDVSDDYGFLPDTDSKAFGYALRITEAYLILAEALAEQDRGGEALAILAQIQSKRFEGAVPADYTEGDAVELVRKERRREMCLEQLRWFDLRRWGMPQIEHVWYDTSMGSQSGRPMRYILEQGDAGYTLPLPEKVIQKNSDLTQVPVNANRQPK